MAVGVPLLLATGAMAAGTALSAVGSMRQAQAQSAAMTYNAQVDQVKAQEATDQAQAQASQVAQDNRRKMGEVEAAYGAAGVDTQGTPLAVMSDQATQGELSRQLTLYQGQIGAQNAQQSAALSSAQAAQTSAMAPVMAAGTLLTGLGGAAARYYAPDAKSSGGSGGTNPGTG